MFLRHVGCRCAATSRITQINTDGSHKLWNTHHAANPLSATKNTNYSIMNPHATQRVTGHLMKISASPQGNLRAYYTTNSYLTENDRCWE